MIPIIFLIVISLIVTYFAITLFSKYKKISATGIEAEGIIFDIENSTTSDNSTITFPIIRFITEKNEWITQKASVSIIPGSYKKGQHIKVVYLKDHPTEFFIKSNLTNAVLILMIIGGISLTAYGVYSLINSI